MLIDWSKLDSTSDKKTYHGYDRMYKYFLSHLVDCNPKVLEIGVQGGDSVDLWMKYFGNPHIVGCDICKKPDNIDFEFHYLDQGDQTQLTLFASSRVDEFDFVIDDGSHCTVHQISTILSLWKCLKPGGIYIIEDIETSYWGRSSIFGYSFDAEKLDQNVVRSSMSLIDSINLEISDKKNDTVFATISEDIEVLAFGYNSVIFVKKNHGLYGKNYVSRPYRHKHLINQFHWKRRLKSKISRLLALGNKV